MPVTMPVLGWKEQTYPALLFNPQPKFTRKWWVIVGDLGCTTVFSSKAQKRFLSQLWFILWVEMFTFIFMLGVPWTLEAFILQENILNRPFGCFNLPCLIGDFVLLLGVIDSYWCELDLNVEVSLPWHPWRISPVLDISGGGRRLRKHQFIKSKPLVSHQWFNPQI